MKIHIIHKMNTQDYFTKHGILWFPINLEVEGKTKNLLPYTETGCRPTMNDFNNIKKVEKRKEYTQYEYGAVDTRYFQHIDVDLQEDKEYSEDTINYVEDLKSKMPYFKSVTKKNPHFIIKNDNLGNSYRIQTNHEDIEVLNKQWGYFKLNDIMINSDKEITPIDEGILADMKPKVEKQKPTPVKEKIINDTPIDEEIQQLVDCIAQADINDYDSWIRIVWALHNDNINNYEIARSLSMKSPKYEDEFFNKLWSNAKSGVNIGTIHFYAKRGNPAQYRIISQKNKLTGTEDNLTEIFLKMNCENLLFFPKDKELYIYKQEKWVLDTDYLILKKLVRTTLINYVTEDIQNLLSNNNGDIKDLLNEKNKIFQKVSNKKTIDNVSSFILQDLANEKRQEEFNTNKEQHNNLHFRNGVYNLLEKKFRKRTKADYITQYLDWDYIDQEDIPNNIQEEVNTFYKKLHPNEEQRKFALSWLSYCLSGDVGVQRFKMNIGYTASNGKSTEFRIHDSIFPIYSKKLDKDTFNISYANKRHKQIRQLQKNPIRFCYCEELDQKKIDVDYLKDFVDANNLSCEIMYGTCESAPIQAKLNTCSNKDFNVDIDEGILRRGLVQMYESRFIKDVEDDWKTHRFKRVDNYGKKFECELYKNAYLHLLLSYFSLNVFIPKKNEEMFKDIAEEYDDFSNIFNELFIHTQDKVDLLHKSELLEIFKTQNKSFTQRQITYELKKMGIKYDKNKMSNGKRGFFVGLKVVEQECEPDDD